MATLTSHTLNGTDGTHAGGIAVTLSVVRGPQIFAAEMDSGGRLQMEIPAETQVATLEALGFTIEGDMAHVPSWRPDVRGSADLVEEVARVASLTKLVGKPLPVPEHSDAALAMTLRIVGETVVLPAAGSECGALTRWW